MFVKGFEVTLYGSVISLSNFSVHSILLLTINKYVPPFTIDLYMCSLSSRNQITYSAKFPNRRNVDKHNIKLIPIGIGASKHFRLRSTIEICILLKEISIDLPYIVIRSLNSIFVNLYKILDPIAFGCGSVRSPDLPMP